MIIIYNSKFIKYFCLKGVEAITIAPFIFVRNSTIDKEVINHEKVHIKQNIEITSISFIIILIGSIFLNFSIICSLLSIFLFYIWYLLEWVIKLLIIKDSYKAYRSISFEIEAYSKEVTNNKSVFDLGFIKHILEIKWNT